MYDADTWNFTMKYMQRKGRFNLCKRCNQTGDETNNNCQECIDNYKFLNDTSATPNNCYEQCDEYYYFNETNKYVCTELEECPNSYSKLIEAKKKCIDDCRCNISPDWRSNINRIILFDVCIIICNFRS